MAAGVYVEVADALRLKRLALRLKRLLVALRHSRPTKSWCAPVDLLDGALRQSAIFLTCNWSSSAEVLHSGSVQHSLIQLNAHSMNYVELNFLAAPEFFRLA
jgi:hypothetical protein